MCIHVEPLLSTLPRSRLCVLHLKLLLAAAAPLSRHCCDGHHSCARRLPQFQRWLRLAIQLICHRGHIRLVHPHATTEGHIQHFPTNVPIPSAVHIVPEDIAQVDMVQGLHLRNTLIPKERHHLADAADQGLCHLSQKEDPGVRYGSPSSGPENRVGTPIVRLPTVVHVHAYPHPSPSPTGMSVPRTDQEGKLLPHPFGTPVQYLPPEQSHVPTTGRAPSGCRPSLAHTVVRSLAQSLTSSIHLSMDKSSRKYCNIYCTRRIQLIEF